MGEQTGHDATVVNAIIFGNLLRLHCDKCCVLAKRRGKSSGVHPSRRRITSPTTMPLIPPLSSVVVPLTNEGDDGWHVGPRQLFTKEEQQMCNVGGLRQWPQMLVVRA